MNLTDPVTLVVLAIGGFAGATLVMAFCVRLAGIQPVTASNSLLAAVGFGLPLAGAAGLLKDPSTAHFGLVAAALAIVIGVGTIKAVFRTTTPLALLAWILNVAAWVLLSSAAIRMRKG
jgi:hypothetical protein